MFPSSVLDFVGAGFAQDAGGTAIRFFGLSTFVATAPMWLTACTLPSSTLLPARGLCFAAAAFSLGAVLLGGRRAIVVVAIVVPLGIAFVRLAVRVRRDGWHPKPSHIALVLGAGMVALAGGLSLAPLRDAVAGIISMVTGRGRGASEVLRADQAAALLADWRRAPMFGHGWGAGIEGYQRSVERPWAYELQYHYLLAQVGIVGSLLLALALCIGVRVVVLAGRKLPEIVPVLYIASAAATAMIIANGTNPYLRAPGHMWAVFLPLAVAGAALMARRGPMAVEPPDKDEDRASTQNFLVREH